MEVASLCMGGGTKDYSECSSEKKKELDDEEKAATAPEALLRVRLCEAPILLLVRFHKALRSELADLRRLTLSASESGCYGGREFFSELLQRFEFLNLAYKYHCASEDEIVFPALDLHTKNVVFTYSLEHDSINELFDSIFNRLNVLIEEEGNQNISKPFQQLVFCLGTIQTSMCQHVLKEEEQVFPLLIRHCSAEEQASLVWQFLSSLPVRLLEDFLPWMMSFISPQEQEEVTNCIRDILPNDKILQEVVMSWLASTKRPSYGTKTGKWLLPILGSSDKSSGNNWNSIQTNSFQKVRQNPVDSLHIWNSAIMKDLREIQQELFPLRSNTGTFSNLDSLVLKIKFLVDCIVLYSNAWEKFFYPVLSQISGVPSFNQHYRFTKIVGLQRLLDYNAQDDHNVPFGKFIEKLCWELDSFMVDVSTQFSIQETQVFPAIRENCTSKMLQQIIYMSLHMLPLGLLKCVITWFSSHLSEEEVKPILNRTEQEDSVVNESFSLLLREWLRVGYSGKISVENFGSDLQKMFKNRTHFFHEQIKESASGSSSLYSVQPSKGKNQRMMTCYSYSFPKFHKGKNHAVSAHHKDPKPIDLIFYFHKALKKDLEYFVLVSAQLSENPGLFNSFLQRFQLVRLLYQVHTDAEDQIAFPALEAKGKFENISQAYTMDHTLEVDQFMEVSLVLDEISEYIDQTKQAKQDLQNLCLSLQDKCKSLHNLLSDHVDREEIELWPLYRECFSIKEQEKITGSILGRTRAEILKDMIPWLMASLTPEEQHNMMSLWGQATRNTMFNEWLGEWLEGYDTGKVDKKMTDISSSFTVDPLEIISTYLSKDAAFNESKGMKECFDHSYKVEQKKDSLEYENDDTLSEYVKLISKGDNDKRKKAETDSMDLLIIDQERNLQGNLKVRYNENLLAMSQEELEAAIRRVSRDSSLDTKMKSYVLQNLMMSRWIATQSSTKVNVASNGEGFSGQSPSYRDSLMKAFGCKHYKRNCKLLSPCCNLLYTCIRCHDEVANHSVDRRSITTMMCMNCLLLQPISNTCSTPSCANLTMARYLCRICKLFDDEREIYHCPYCNLCRVGKGLGIDYFHCMNCNACMARSLSVHTCREKCLEENCPICHEYIFTSSSPVKALVCGHLMHSTCFQDYTNVHYTCPICSKSLGDMQVYFRMLDALLAEEKMPDEYSGKSQGILCNDCEKRGSAPFHWLYHKCPHCGSYNTRLL